MTGQSKQQFHIPEILAPAGTEGALKAAVNAGCDAVYLGGSLFSARAFAGNFDADAVVRAIEFCHLFDVKVYMTVNTLLKEQEISALESYMRPFCETGLDGVIIQDPGVARILGNAFPDLPLHASTQMSISSVYGAKFLKSLGFTRIVPARELTLREITEIKSQVDIEIESFVHGAMCYAYSGKCLFSSFLGGRSGNRGRCAQPCRQRYELKTESADGQNRKPVREYIMSMKDLCTLAELPELIDAGIDSFKIEGRMKNPSYVAATVDAYRRARNLYLSSGDSQRNRGEYRELADQLILRMQDIYNRGGFYSGYYFPKEPVSEKGSSFTAEKGRPMITPERPNHTGLLLGKVKKVQGPDVSIQLTHPVHRQDVLEIEEAGVELTSPVDCAGDGILILKGKELKKIRPGMRVFRTRNQQLLDSVEEDLIRRERKVPAKAVVIARKGAPLQIRLTSRDGAVTVRVEGGSVEQAASSPSTRESLLEKLSRTGGTHVELDADCEMDPDVFIPMSEFNALRRKAVEQFKQALAARYYRK
ncbi:MAG: U32 family peptidase [Parasporobacterium sp.]|nr:U32 family peptidase [Parasporobacterium sp.]